MRVGDCITEALGAINSLKQSGEARAHLPTFGADAGGLAKQRVQGKALFLDFWFKECPPCKTGLAHLKTLEAQTAAEGKAIYPLLISDLQTNSQELEDRRLASDRLVAELGNANWDRVYVDNSQAGEANYAAVLRLFDLPRLGYPTSVIVDKHGHIVWIGHATEGNVAEVKAAIDKAQGNAYPETTCY